MRQSIQVAADQIKKEGIEQGLSIWVLRDQYVTVEEAKEISDLYLAHIDTMKSEFNIWHTSWAIANLYKWGDDAIKAVLEPAFQKATKQPERLTGMVKNSANNLINGEKITSVYAHMQYDTRRFEVGDVVEVGDVLGNTGSTGMSTGPHLHFEIRIGGINGTKVDPLEWLWANTN